MTSINASGLTPSATCWVGLGGVHPHPQETAGGPPVAEIIARAERRVRLQKYHAGLKAECRMISVLIERPLPRNFNQRTTASLVELTIELREAKIRWLRSVMETGPGPVNFAADFERHQRWAEAGLQLPSLRAVRASDG